MKELYKHNRVSLDEIKVKFKESKRVALVQATGTGKSFVFMNLVNEMFTNKKVAYVVPKWAIRDNIKRYSDFTEIENQIDFLSYNYFNSEEVIESVASSYDLIVIDEMHHIASEIYGLNLYKCLLRSEELGNYSLGMTATNEIKNESGYHNIANEFFNDNAVYGLSVEEGIMTGILPQVEYMLCVTEEVEEGLRTKLDIEGSSLTLKETVQRNPRGKWLAYFSSIEELNNMQRVLTDLLPKHKQLAAHSKVDNTLEIINEFDSYDGDCILSSVDMLLEGLHVSTVEGILLFRNVQSSTVFWQVLGRLLSIGSTNSPLFVDVCGSIDNIKPITDTVKKSSQSHRNNIGCNSRDIFKVTIESIKQSNLLELLQGKLQGWKEYRGIRWNSSRSLCESLNKHKGYAQILRKNFKDMSDEDIIDYALDTDKYPGLKIYKGICWNNTAELCKALGRHSSYIYNYRKRHPDIRDEEIIDINLDLKKTVIKTYKDISWDTDVNLSKALNKGNHYVRQVRKNHPGISEEEIINMTIKSYEEKEYRGIIWCTKVDLCRALLKSDSYYKTHLYRNIQDTAELMIDYVLSKDLPIDELYSLLPSAEQKEDKYESVMKFSEEHPEILEDYIKDGKLIKKEK